MKKITIESRKDGKCGTYFSIVGTGITGDNFKGVRKFARAYKDALTDYLNNEFQGCFAFYICGYSAPMQNYMREKWAKEGVMI